MGMSYKRAWSLVQALNDGWGRPLVETTRGGAAQGGANLSQAGHSVLSHYRQMERAAAHAIAKDVASLRRDMFKKK
jgi:molybdate transport system regulatory protein